LSLHSELAWASPSFLPGLAKGFQPRASWATGLFLVVIAMLASTLGGYITGRGQDFWSHIRRSKVSSVTGTEMSALGQKQTLTSHGTSCPLSPKADMCAATTDVH